MDRPDPNIDELLDRYLQGKCTEAESLWVEQWYAQLPEAGQTVSREQILEDKETLLRRLRRSRRRESIWRWQKVSIAAAVVLTIGLGLFLFVNKGYDSAASQEIADLPPGGNHAFLTLADGTVINLDTLSIGAVLDAKDINIQKAADGELVYEIKSNGVKPYAPQTSNTPSYNTIETPKGGQFQVRLPDGSKVWLNASSSLTYPVDFNVRGREVRLQGEGYFEVRADRERPFTVSSGGQQVQVLGTAFNLSAYADEESIATTLVAGSVRVSGTSGGGDEVLRPGFRSVWRDGRFSVEQVDVQDYVSWRDGLIVLNDADLPAILRQIGRWYDVEFELPDLPETRKAYGEIRRDVPLSHVLGALQKSYNVTFKMEGRRIMVQR